MGNKRFIGLFLVLCLAGAAAGVGAYTFIYARGASYLTDDPAACANCHVMQDYYDAWSRGSHHAVAVCNDCHAPHDLLGKYTTKAVNGFNHALAFTTNRFHEPIQITPRNRAITEEACRSCHRDIVHAIDLVHASGVVHASSVLGAGGERMSCVRCHASVGHLR